MNADGSIRGNDNDADPLRFEPHYRRIDSPEQVQIYEAIIVDQGVPRFYRYKEIKSGGASADAAARLIRELDDSLHFFQHMDRQQQSEVGQLCLAGEAAVVAPLAESLKHETALAVETLAPGSVLASGTGIAESLAAAVGAGGGLS